MSQSRNLSIDTVAGIMILYMVYTHVCQHFNLQQSNCYLILERFLYFFMPWFFFKAGMFYNSREGFMLKSIDRLIKPFLIYSLIGHLCYVFICAWKGTVNIQEIFPIYSLLMFGAIPGNLPLWFLLTLFICRIIFDKLMRCHVNPLLIAFVAIMGAFGLHIIGFSRPYYVVNSMTGMFFMSIGYCVSKKYRITPPFLLLCVIVYALSIIFPSFVGMRSNRLYYGYYLLWIIYSVCGIVCINKVVEYCPSLNKLRLYVFGRYSMEIYCTHWIILLFL